MEKTKFRYRHIARIVIKAETPIAVGSGLSDILTDAPIIRDVNGLPYIPGTSLAGVLRHALSIGEGTESIFGHHDDKGGMGSRLIVSDAVMIGAEGIALDGLQVIDWKNDYYQHFKDLPVRQHVRINASGTGEDNGKFDNQVVYKGTRFVFEMEVYSAENVEKCFDDALAKLYTTTFRIGSGTRNGYGKIDIVSIKKALIDLKDEKQMKLYLSKSSSLAVEWAEFKDEPYKNTADNDWKKYVLKLEPLDFFKFGSGLGDNDVDEIPVAENVVDWTDNGKPTVEKQQLLIPATSVKGALAHRTAYHYNKIKKYYFGDSKAKTGDENPAVAAIFGVAGDGKSSESIKRGNIIIDDVLKKPLYNKILTHVKIDRFTGGTINGALFNEKVSYGEGEKYEITIFVLKKALEDNEIRTAFENSLNDICNGLLPLGGSVNRGHGIFIGKLTING